MSSTAPRRIGKKTGPKPQFTDADAIHAALEIGLSSFTMTAVAKQIGVVPSALYRRFESQVDLTLAAMSYVVDTELKGPTASSWQEILREYAHCMIDGFKAHPGLAAAIYNTPGCHLVVIPMLNQYIEALKAHDFPGDEARISFAIDFIGDTIIGTTIAIEAMRAAQHDGNTGLEHARKLFADQPIDPANYYLSPQEGWTDLDSIMPKVEFIIAGLEAGIDVE
ncbi:TetR/AcrR family transcriptional regulator [Corynebacterium casei]|uniref:TetR/AcrR family transcriptional regulator n=1 Tax=Corynebacterium casei TaxID=160386 RepID=UPI003FD48FED